MPVKPVVEYPNPLLRKQATQVQKITPLIQELAQNLLDTLGSFPGCVGLAANQIGAGENVVVIDISSKQPGAKPRVLINPEIMEMAEEKFLREGCLSVQHLTANVRRFQRVRLRWTDLQGTIRLETLTGLEAICVQHEIDHLRGMLFIDRVLNPTADIFRRKRYLH
ncbi:MAG: peptide deformylase [Candidatus Omnitrophica bacterium]|nr:peptide deformylase [Candidatus Omnitrophota bacterium]